MRKISSVIPVYNEEDNLAKLFAELRPVAEGPIILLFTLLPYLIAKFFDREPRRVSSFREIRLGSQGQRRQTVASPVDMVPSVLGLIGLEDPHQCWGEICALCLRRTRVSLQEAKTIWL